MTAAISSSPSAASSAAGIRDHPAQLESFGTHCNFAPCGLADFLPFQCPHCQHSYCSSHRTPESHECQSYEALDRRAVPCPICGRVLKLDEYMRRHPGVARQQVDIDAVMEEHLSSGGCAKVDSSNGLLVPSEHQRESATTKKTERQCRYGRCTNQCWIDLRCDKCGRGFCPTHRDPRHHKCGPAGFGSRSGTDSSRSASPLPPTTSSSKSTSAQSNKNAGQAATTLFNKLSLKNPKTAASTSSPSAAASASTHPSSYKVPATSDSRPNASSASQPTMSSPSTGLSKLKHHLPSSSGTSEDRIASKRAAKERESAALALKKRAEKG